MFADIDDVRRKRKRVLEEVEDRPGEPPND